MPEIGFFGPVILGRIPNLSAITEPRSYFQNPYVDLEQSRAVFHCKYVAQNAGSSAFVTLFAETGVSHLKGVLCLVS